MNERPYLDEVNALDLAEYVLFGHDDHFTYPESELTQDDYDKFEKHLQGVRARLLSANVYVSL